MPSKHEEKMQHEEKIPRGVHALQRDHRLGSWGDICGSVGRPELLESIKPVPGYGVA